MAFTTMGRGNQWQSQPQKSPRAATVASRGQALLRRAAGRCRTGAWRSSRRWHPAAQRLRDWALGHLGTGSRRDSGGRRRAGCVPREGGKASRLPPAWHRRPQPAGRQVASGAAERCGAARKSRRAGNGEGKTGDLESWVPGCLLGRWPRPSPATSDEPPAEAHEATNPRRLPSPVFTNHHRRGATSGRPD